MWCTFQTHFSLGRRDQITKEESEKKHLYFSLSFKLVHLLQNKPHFLQNEFALQNEFFYIVKLFLTELNFLKRDTNIYFKQIYLKKKIY